MRSRDVARMKTFERSNRCHLLDAARLHTMLRGFALLSVSQKWTKSLARSLRLCYHRNGFVEPSKPIDLRGTLAGREKNNKADRSTRRRGVSTLRTVIRGHARASEASTDTNAPIANRSSGRVHSLVSELRNSLEKRTASLSRGWNAEERRGRGAALM
jgi:hypothetical protein